MQGGKHHAIFHSKNNSIFPQSACCCIANILLSKHPLSISLSLAGENEASPAEALLHRFSINIFFLFRNAPHHVLLMLFMHFCVKLIVVVCPMRTWVVGGKEHNKKHVSTISNNMQSGAFTRTSADVILGKLPWGGGNYFNSFITKYLSLFCN